MTSHGLPSLSRMGVMEVTNKEAVKWLRNLIGELGASEYRGLWHYEQALCEIVEMLELSADRPRWIPLPEPYEENCDTCKHQSESWDSETCDGCCGNHSNYERR